MDLEAIIKEAINAHQNRSWSEAEEKAMKSCIKKGMTYASVIEVFKRAGSRRTCRGIREKYSAMKLELKYDKTI
jgi:hypothetical protein